MRLVRVRTGGLSRVAAACMIAASVVACNVSSPGQPTEGPSPTPVNGGDATDASTATIAGFGNYPEFHDPASGLTLIFGTPDLGAGRNRLAFAITGSQGFIRLPVVTLKTYFYPAGSDGPAEGPVQTVTARFHEFPLGTRGSYVTYVDLDRHGAWGIEASFPRPDGAIASIEFGTEVLNAPKAPGIGDPAPRSVTPTAATAGSLEKLTTAGEPDPELYRQSIADAVASGRPTVVVFTSPAFCTTPLCGPQVEVLSSLRATYRELANFIHVDLYESPDQIKGDLSTARRSPAVKEWGLETDEWTFVIDSAGRVAGRFESFAGEQELVELLDAVLGGQPAP